MVCKRVTLNGECISNYVKTPKNEIVAIHRERANDTYIKIYNPTTQKWRSMKVIDSEYNLSDDKLFMVLSIHNPLEILMNGFIYTHCKQRGNINRIPLEMIQLCLTYYSSFTFALNILQYTQPDNTMYDDFYAHSGLDDVEKRVSNTYFATIDTTSNQMSNLIRYSDNIHAPKSFNTITADITKYHIISSDSGSNICHLKWKLISFDNAPPKFVQTIPMSSTNKFINMLKLVYCKHNDSLFMITKIKNRPMILQYNQDNGWEIIDNNFPHSVDNVACDISNDEKYLVFIGNMINKIKKIPVYHLNVFVFDLSKRKWLKANIKLGTALQSWRGMRMLILATNDVHIFSDAGHYHDCFNFNDLLSKVR